MLLAPYRGGDVWVRVVYVGASPYAMLYDPVGVGGGVRVVYVGASPYAMIYDPFRVSKVDRKKSQRPMAKAAIKREKSDARISFSEREQARNEVSIAKVRVSALYRLPRWLCLPLSRLGSAHASMALHSLLHRFSPR